ncbi:MAG TPA: outer membrane beta-barrel protein, partial [Acetobacteraceae bacterium]|nr:outer membrane beta-barrel protein [Acetobacteraceae bacterium]
SIGAFVSIDDLRSLNIPSQSRTDWTGSLGGTLDIGRDRLTLAAAHLSLHQDRTAVDALPTDQPVAYEVNDFRLNYSHTFNRLSLIPSLELTSYRFASTTIMGVSTPQADRDRDVLQGGMAASYELAPQRNLVVVLRGLGSLYTAPAPGAPTRNSSGLIALTGIDYSGSDWGLRLLFGWEQRQFAAPQYQAHGAPVAEADASWSPTGMTTLTATLARTIEDAAQEGVAGYTYTTAHLTIDHEYLRNVLLRGFAGVQRADFLQGGGTQTSYTLGAGVTWLLNRRMRVSGTEVFTDLRSSHGQSASVGGSYVRSITLLTLGFGL